MPVKGAMIYSSQTTPTPTPSGQPLPPGATPTVANSAAPSSPPPPVTTPDLPPRYTGPRAKGYGYSNVGSPTIMTTNGNVIPNPALNPSAISGTANGLAPINERGGPYSAHNPADNIVISTVPDNSLGMPTVSTQQLALIKQSLAEEQYGGPQGKVAGSNTISDIGFTVTKEPNGTYSTYNALAAFLAPFTGGTNVSSGSSPSYYNVPSKGSPPVSLGLGSAIGEPSISGGGVNTPQSVGQNQGQVALGEVPAGYQGVTGIQLGNEVLKAQTNLVNAGANLNQYFGVSGNPNAPEYGGQAQFQFPSIAQIMATAQKSTGAARVTQPAVNAKGLTPLSVSILSNGFQPTAVQKPITPLAISSSTLAESDALRASIGLGTLESIMPVNVVNGTQSLPTFEQEEQIFTNNLVSSAKEAGANTINVGIETLYNFGGGLSATKTSPLENIPVSSTGSVIPSILKANAGKQLVFSFTSAPQALQTIGFQTQLNTGQPSTPAISLFGVAMPLPEPVNTFLSNAINTIKSDVISLAASVTSAAQKGLASNGTAFDKAYGILENEAQVFTSGYVGTATLLGDLAPPLKPVITPIVSLIPANLQTAPTLTEGWQQYVSTRVVPTELGSIVSGQPFEGLGYFEDPIAAKAGSIFADVALNVLAAKAVGKVGNFVGYYGTKVGAELGVPEGALRAGQAIINPIGFGQEIGVVPKVEELAFPVKIPAPSPAFAETAGNSLLYKGLVLGKNGLVGNVTGEGIKIGTPTITKLSNVVASGSEGTTLAEGSPFQTNVVLKSLATTSSPIDQTWNQKKIITTPEGGEVLVNQSNPLSPSSPSSPNQPPELIISGGQGTFGVVPVSTPPSAYPVSSPFSLVPASPYAIGGINVFNAERLLTLESIATESSGVSSEAIRPFADIILKPLETPEQTEALFQVISKYQKPFAFGLKGLKSGDYSLGVIKGSLTQEPQVLNEFRRLAGDVEAMPLNNPELEAKFTEELASELNIVAKPNQLFESTGSEVVLKNLNEQGELISEQKIFEFAGHKNEEGEYQTTSGYVFGQRTPEGYVTARSKAGTPIKISKLRKQQLRKIAPAGSLQNMKTIQNVKKITPEEAAYQLNITEKNQVIGTEAKRIKDIPDILGISKSIGNRLATVDIKEEKGAIVGAEAEHLTDLYPNVNFQEPFKNKPIDLEEAQEEKIQISESKAPHSILSSYKRTEPKPIPTSTLPSNVKEKSVSPSSVLEEESSISNKELSSIKSSPSPSSRLSKSPYKSAIKMTASKIPSLSKSPSQGSLLSTNENKASKLSSNPSKSPSKPSTTSPKNISQISFTPITPSKSLSLSLDKTFDVVLPPSGGGKALLLDEKKLQPIPKSERTKGDRADFLGNSSEYNVEGIFNRGEIVYGLGKISKLRNKDKSQDARDYSMRMQGKPTERKTYHNDLFKSKDNTLKMKGSSEFKLEGKKEIKKKLKL